MKYLIYSVFLLSGLVLALSGCGDPYKSAKASLNSQTDSLSYSFGYLSAANLAGEGIKDLDIENFIAGFNTGMEENEALIDQMEMQMLLQAYFQDLQMRQMEERTAQADVNIQRGRAFLEENLNNSDVFETGSGLQYRILEEGDGPKPTATDRVQVHYHGTLINDTVFDSSVDRGEPVTFGLNQVIPGWTEGVQLMNVGSKYQFFIPPDLAYGNNPPPGSPIEAGSVLIFEVELLDIR